MSRKKNKSYFHELAQKEIDELIKVNRSIEYIMENYELAKKLSECLE